MVTTKENMTALSETFGDAICAIFNDKVVNNRKSHSFTFDSYGPQDNPKWTCVLIVEGEKFCGVFGKTKKAAKKQALTLWYEHARSIDRLSCLDLVEATPEMNSVDNMMSMLDLDKASKTVLASQRDSSHTYDASRPLTIPKSDVSFTDRANVFPNLCNRWFNIGTSIWSAGSDTKFKILEVVDLPVDALALMRTDPIYQPFRSYAFSRPNMTMRLQLNSTKFHQGLAIVAVRYGSAFDGTAGFEITDARQLVQMNHCLLDASESNVAELKIPFVSQLDMVGNAAGPNNSPQYTSTIYIGVLSDLRTGDGNTNAISYTKFIKFSCEDKQTEFFGQRTVLVPKKIDVNLKDLKLKAITGAVKASYTDDKGTKHPIEIAKDTIVDTKAKIDTKQFPGVDLIEIEGKAEDQCIMTTDGEFDCWYYTGEKDESGDWIKKHKFVKKGENTKLPVGITIEDCPVKNELYIQQDLVNMSVRNETQEKIEISFPNEEGGYHLEEIAPDGVYKMPWKLPRFNSPMDLVLSVRNKKKLMYPLHVYNQSYEKTYFVVYNEDKSVRRRYVCEPQKWIHIEEISVDCADNYEQNTLDVEPDHPSLPATPEGGSISGMIVDHVAPKGCDRWKEHAKEKASNEFWKFADPLIEAGNWIGGVIGIDVPFEDIAETVQPRTSGSTGAKTQEYNEPICGADPSTWSPTPLEAKPESGRFGLDGVAVMPWSGPQLSTSRGPKWSRALKLNPLMHTNHGVASVPLEPTPQFKGEYIKRIWGWLTSFDIPVATAKPGDILYLGDISPCQAAAHATDELIFPPVSVLSSYYQFYTGDLELMVYVAKSPIASFRMAVYTSPDVPITSYAIAQNCPKIVFDFEEGKSFSTILPYYAPTRVANLKVPEIEAAGGGFKSYGYFAVGLESPVISMESLASTINVMLFLRAAPNFMLYVPSVPTMLEYQATPDGFGKGKVREGIFAEKKKAILAIPEMEERVADNGPSVSPLINDPRLLAGVHHFPDTQAVDALAGRFNLVAYDVVNFKEKKLYSRHHDLSAEIVGSVVGFAFDVNFGSPFARAKWARVNFMHALHDAFRFSRGSFNYQLVMSSSRPIQVAIRHFPSVGAVIKTLDYTNLTDTLDESRGLNIANELLVSPQQTIFPFEIPYTQEMNYLVNKYDPSINGLYGASAYSNGMVEISMRLPLLMPEEDLTVEWQLWQSLCADASMYMFQGFPFYTVGNTYLNANKDGLKYVQANQVKTDEEVQGRPESGEWTYPSDILMMKYRETKQRRWLLEARKAKKIEEKYLATVKAQPENDTVNNVLNSGLVNVGLAAASCIPGANVVATPLLAMNTARRGNIMMNSLQNVLKELENGVESTKSFFKALPDVVGQAIQTWLTAIGDFCKNKLINVVSICSSVYMFCNSTTGAMKAAALVGIIGGLGLITMSSFTEAINVVRNLFTTAEPVGATPESDDIIFNQNKSLWVSILIAGISSFAGLDGKSSILKQLAKMASEFFRTGLTASRFLQTNLECIQAMIYAIVGWEHPEIESIKEIQASGIDVVEWGKEVLLITESYELTKVMNDPQMQLRVCELKQQGDFIATHSKGLDANKIKSFDAIYKRIFSLYDRVGLKSTPNARMEPISLWISGPPGLGKSAMTKKLAIDLCSKMGIVHNGDPVYTRNPADPYWSNYFNQPIVVLEDFGIVREPQVVAATLQDFMSLNSPAEYSPKFADIEDKGRVVAPSVLITNCNETYPKPNICANLEALWRRRDLVLKTDFAPWVKEEYPGIRNLKDPRFNSWDRVSRFEHLIFEVMDPVEERVIDSGLDYKVLFETYVPKLVEIHHRRVAYSKEMNDLDQVLSVASWARTDTSVERKYNRNLRDVVAAKAEPQCDDRIMKCPFPEDPTKCFGLTPTFCCSTTLVIGKKEVAAINVLGDFEAHCLQEGIPETTVAALRTIRSMRVPDGTFCIHTFLEPETAHFCWDHNTLVWRGCEGVGPGHYTMEKMTVLQESCGPSCVYQDPVRGRIWWRDYFDQLKTAYQNDLLGHIYRPTEENFQWPKGCELTTPLTRVLYDALANAWEKIKEVSLKLWDYAEYYWIPLGMISIILNVYSAYSVASCPMYDRAHGMSAMATNVPGAIVGRLFNQAPTPELCNSGAVTTGGASVRAVKLAGKLAKAQGGYDIRRLIYRNTVYLYLSDERKTKSIMGIGIRGRTAIIPYHVFAYFKNGCSVKVVFNGNADVGAMLEFPSLDMFKITRVEDVDMCFVDFPKKCPLFRRIDHLIMNADDCVRVGTKASLFYHPMANEPRIHELNITPVTQPMYYDLEGVMQHQTFAGWYYDVHGAGMCGSVLADVKHQKIVAMHVASIGDEGYAQGLSADWISEYDFPDDPLDIVEPEKEDFEPLVCPVGEYIPIGAMAREECRPLPCKTKIAKSPAFGVLGEPARYPVELKTPGEPVMGITKLTTALEKGTNPTRAFPPKDVDRAFQWLENEILTLATPVAAVKDCRSFQDAVFGVAGVPFMDPMRLNTSTGFPLCVQYPAKKKQHFLEYEDHPKGRILKGFRPELVRLYEEAHKQRLERVIPYSPYYAFLKDERLKPGKAPRLINGCSFAETLEWRRYCLDFFAAFQNAGLDVGSGIGLNLRSADATRLVQKLLEKGEKILTADYKAFGPGLDSELVTRLSKLVNDWYAKFGSLKKTHKNVRDVLFDGLAHARHVAYDLEFVSVCGSPSGNPFTAPINTLVNKLYIILAYIGIFRDNPALCNEQAFRNLFYPCAYGDDFIASVSEQICERFNNVTISEYLSQFGIIMTDALKDGTMRKYCTVEESTFLKHYFLKHPDRGGFYMAALEKNVIEDIPSWYRTPCEDVLEQTMVNSDQAVRFAYSWGRDYYDSVVSKLRSFWSRKKRLFVPLTWEEIDSQCFDVEKGTNEVSEDLVFLDNLFNAQ